MPDGSEFVFNTKKDTEPTSADMLAGIGDQGTAISSVSDPTIPQGTADVNTQYTQDSEKYSRTGESFASLMEQMEEKIKQYGGMELPGRGRKGELCSQKIYISVAFPFSILRRNTVY